MRRKSEETTFVLRVTMKKRWMPHFIAMLKYMEYLGGIGSSRQVTLYADGDGDFRPKFRTLFGRKLKSDANPIKDRHGNRVYDAG